MMNCKDIQKIGQFPTRRFRNFLAVISTLGILIIISASGLPGCSKNSVEPPPDTPQDQFRMGVIGYLPDYRLSAVSSSIAIQMTHMIYFSIEPNADGTLDLSRYDIGARTTLSYFRRDNPDLKLIIGVGGWGRSANFAAMALSETNRTRFVSTLLTFCRSYYFDGVDLDWEFPANSSEQNAYTNLIAQLGDSCHTNNMTLSAALNPYQTLNQTAYGYLDRVHIMSYDHSGRHATYDQAVGDVGIFINRGIPPQKLYLGIPFYGRGIQDFSQTLGYDEIVTRYHPAENIDEVDGYYFNNIGTVQQKSEYALSMGLGGVMIWEIGQDADGDASLLKAIYHKATGDTLAKIF
jgi:chitinase